MFIQINQHLYIVFHFQTLQEPEGDGKELDAEFGGHRVLSVMRPPTQQFHAQGTVSARTINRAYLLLTENPLNHCSTVVQVLIFPFLTLVYI